MGHHPTHFVHFATALAQAGAEVVPFCIDDEDFKCRLESSHCPSNALAGISEARQLLGPVEIRDSRRGLRGFFNAIKFFGRLGRQLRQWEKQQGKKIDLVFFACIYDWHFAHFRMVENLFGFPWGGVYLHARFFRMPGSVIPYKQINPCPEKIFSSKLLRCVAIRDPSAVEAMARVARGRPVIVFPETTNSELPLSGSPCWSLARKVDVLSAGRPIVSLTGHLAWTKGMLDFTELVHRDDMQDVFFVLGGEVDWTEVSAEAKAKAVAVWKSAPNIHVHLDRLPELTMNALVSRSDVVYAAYRSFPNSSNVLTKCAFFERMAVVSDGYLMAEQVRAFGLGQVVPEGNLDSIAGAIRLMSKAAGNASAEKKDFAAFRRLHSQEALTKAFCQVIDTVR